MRGERAERLQAVVLTVIVAAAVFRLVYGQYVISPLTAPDSQTYDAAGRAFAHGLLHHIPRVPYYPAGYPIFVGAVYALFGTSPAAVVVVQVLLLAAATYVAFLTLSREFGSAVGSGTAVLMSLSPALTAIAT